MDALTDELVVKLLPALAEAARADRRTAERFVPPRTGILEETAARRHQFVFGRRGVGKSTLLRKIESLKETGTEVIFVDIETLRGRPYPDVLIELLIELLTALKQRLRPPWWRVDLYARRTNALRQLSSLISVLRHLLDEPQIAERTIRELRSKQAGGSAGAQLDVSFLRHGRVHAGADARTTSERESAREARYLESKMDGLLGAAVLIRSALANAHKHLGDEATLIVLDDFYHIPYDDQPDVLAYLHQIVKNLDIYLKVCGVRHRIQPFVEGNPPRGMQLGQDAGDVSLDITLERFQTAQQFLEQVLAGICAPLGVDFELLVTEGGRQRLVLGSGGVARDYLYLTQMALRNANERGTNPSRPHNRIGAEDVNEAAATLSAQKQQDLALDAGPNADQLRERLTDVTKFCLDVNGTNVFLIEGTRLQEEDWGKEIQALSDLRLVHQIGNLSVQTGSYRGRRFVGFTLDLSNYTGTRSERIRQIEFWTAPGRQDIRRASLIYVPGSSGRVPRSSAATTTTTEDEVLEGEWVQTDIFSLLADTPADPAT
jgi:hypothetical protein